ncbi:hypothetical protein [Brachybacterium muris]|uniref:Uncharacterized protein n=1 Tax=Brachybacterium muris UCD-AY4 TaxID=1249481 RepID=A0A022L3I8_9MICO|nr:hypothetical protein [Brachybacterium muris]EYT50580.1 hypothetical protein D641_0104475 [Brachybacterium muris UCD-AY4]
MNTKTTSTGQAAHIVAGYIGTEATDHRAQDLVTRWATATADADGHHPDLEHDLTPEDRDLLNDWLDDTARDTLIAVALDPATRIDTDGTRFENTEPIHVAGATVTVQTMHTGDDYDQHVVLTVGDQPLTALEARHLAASILEAADQIDGRESSVHSIKR